MMEMPDADALKNRLRAYGITTDTTIIPAGLDLDDELTRAIVDAGRIAGYSAWSTWTTETRFFDNPRDGLMSLESKVDGSSAITIKDEYGESDMVAGIDYELQPYNENLKTHVRFRRQPLGSIRAISVTATWGDDAIPEPVHFAILDLATVRVLDILAAAGGSYQRVKMGSTEVEFENAYPLLRERILKGARYTLMEYGV
jgi:hypothetical protein